MLWRRELHERPTVRPVSAAALVVALVVSVLAVVGSTATPTPVDAATGGQASKYVSISPIRVLNTRDPGFGPLPDFGILSVDPLVPAVVSAAGVDPLDIEAVAISLTIVEPAAGGYLKTWPTAEPTPPRVSASAVNNQSALEDIANFSIVPVGANGRISIQARRSTDVIVDVQGVFVRTTSSRDGRFVPLGTPQRALDTRNSTPVQGKTQVVVDLNAAVGIPIDASAAVINLVATSTQERGYLTAFPGGDRPRASNLNYPAGGHDIAVNAITRLDDGKITVYANGTTDLIVDVIGYMTGDTADDSSSGLFVAFPPERHYDSRPNKAPFGSTALDRNSRSFTVAGRLSVPATGVLAVASNLTMTQTDGPGNLVAFPKSPKPPRYSTVNSVFNQHTIANHAIVALDNGEFSIFSARRSDVVVDLSGYFLDGTTTPPETPRRVNTDPAPDPDIVQTPVDAPMPRSDNYNLLFRATSETALAPHTRNGLDYYGWNPCNEITYAVNARRATPTQKAALDQAIRDVEMASGFDFRYVGEASGKMSINAIDTRVVGGGAPAMAVIGFSDPYETPILRGTTIGIGGIGRGIGSSRFPIEEDPLTGVAFVVRNGFAFADSTDVSSPAELRATFAHEIAHMVGLDHVNTPGELMFSRLTDQLTFGNGDKSGLWSIGARACGSRLTRAAESEPVGIDLVRWVADDADHVDHIDHAD